MTKTEINAVLKENEFGFVKMQTSMYKLTKHSANLKGIRGGSIGPLTATSAHLTHNDNAVMRLKSALRELAPDLTDSSANGLKVVFTINGKPVTYDFKWQLFPTYAGRTYDASYMTYWLVLQK